MYTTELQLKVNCGGLKVNCTRKSLGCCWLGCHHQLAAHSKEIKTFECSSQKNLLLPKILAVQVTRPISFEAEKLFNDLPPG